ncbi:MAG: glycoside hydrolase family 16 protein [Flavobacteriales bacterium]|jgi:hypothetical protein
MNTRRALPFLLLGILMAISCHQSEPDDVLGRKGDIVHFSGLLWDVKSGFNGPGPNHFSKAYKNVWVDELGYLHLSILRGDDGQWYSSEVISQDTMGYGTYAFTIQADPLQFASNVVLGLFTWDNNTFYEQANSEVDIEFSKWGNEDDIYPLTMSVQPVFFGTYYPERSHEAVVNPAYIQGVSTHVFHWTDTLITWASYRGTDFRNAAPFATWEFGLDNPPRIKYENGLASLPVVIPAPGSTTNARMNFWTLAYLANGPSNGMEHEVVIQRFEYIPLP